MTAYHEGEDPAVATITAPKVVEEEEEVLAEEGGAVEGTGEESSADAEEGKSD